MWVENSKPRLYKHLIAQKIASSHFIDPINGIELIESFIPSSNFDGKIIIKEKKKVVKEAKKYRLEIVI